MPQGVDAGIQANRVRISDKVTTMHLEDGGGMVLAARQKGKDWLICTTSTCAESTGVARVRWHKDGTWTCVRVPRTPKRVTLAPRTPRAALDMSAARITEPLRRHRRQV